MVFNPSAMREPEPEILEPEPAPITANSSLEFLQRVYRDPYQPLGTRLRAAIAALPHETPRLAVQARFDGGPGFAARLEMARARTGGMIEAAKPLEAQSANGGVADSESPRDVG